MKQDERYQARGVSAQKNEVHQAIKHLDKGEYPMAFAKILPDVVAHAESESPYCNIMHADTAGTKTALAYLYWRETGDASVWRGIAQDAIIMNIDDMICVGCFEPIVLSSTIGRNKHLISQEVISEVIKGAQAVIEDLCNMGLNVISSGGETADVGDIVRTIDVGMTAFSRMRRSDVLENDIRPGQKIVALASYGQAAYESKYNSGIGSNGLTSARHDVLNKSYAEKYPEAFAPQTSMDYVFTGPHLLSDKISIRDKSYLISDLLLSPTRTYYPVLSQVMQLVRKQIHGIIHCTGGAQTKVLKFVEDVTIEKVNMFTPPPVFDLIQQASGASWHEMYQVFNMGHRMELFVDDEAVDTIIEVAKSFDIEARCIGEVVPKGGYDLRILSPDKQNIIYD